VTICLATKGVLCQHPADVGRCTFSPILDFDVELILKKPTGLLAICLDIVPTPSSFYVEDTSVIVSTPKGFFVEGVDALGIPMDFHVEDTGFVSSPMGFTVEDV